MDPKPKMYTRQSSSVVRFIKWCSFIFTIREWQVKKLSGNYTYVQVTIKGNASHGWGLSVRFLKRE